MESNALHTLASTHREVTQFVIKVLTKVFPVAVWGSAHNLDIIKKAVEKFVSLPRGGMVTAHNLMCGFKISDCEWVATARARETNAPIRPLDLLKRQFLLKQVLGWVFGYYIVNVLKTAFYITEHGAFGDCTFYFRQDIWEQATKPILYRILNLQYEEIDKERSHMYALGPSRIRLVPKSTGARTITDMRANNSKLKEVQKVLVYETKQQKNILGSAIDGIQQLRETLIEYRSRVSDKGKCFDTVKQDILLKVVKKTVSKHEYIIQKYGILQQFTGTIIRLFQHDAISFDELRPFSERAEEWAAKNRGAILVDNTGNWFYCTGDVQKSKKSAIDKKLEFPKVPVFQVFFQAKKDTELRNLAKYSKKGFRPLEPLQMPTSMRRTSTRI
ncbi:hypothetical protein DFQ29_005204 [Apophysomyces sp. BC1021]|nr:hypothetical protein DFQ29_005204 [Apophysomyces sp. BC1021]